MPADPIDPLAASASAPSLAPKAETPAPAPQPATPPAPTADAVLVPRHYPRTKGDRHQALKTEFAPVLGVKQVFARHCGMHDTLITGSEPRNHRYWPTNSPLAGQEFYDWTDRGDGIRLGTLTPEAKEYLDEQAR